MEVKIILIRIKGEGKLEGRGGVKGGRERNHPGGRAQAREGVGGDFQGNMLNYEKLRIMER